MRNNEINIRDPFVLAEDGIFYLYGTETETYGVQCGGFNVYTSRDLEEWSEPVQCFNSKKYRLNRGVNWGPNVHKYKGAYYMFATFTTTDPLRGTFVLKSDSPMGPFVPHSNGALTPEHWSSLYGSLYVDKNGVPYLFFGHDHTQIVNSSICVVELTEDLTEPKGEVKTLFSGSDPHYVTRKRLFQYFLTDGPFVYEDINGNPVLLWSTSIDSKYCQCYSKLRNGNVYGPYDHMSPIPNVDGGHGMIFKNGDKIMLVYHSPNRPGFEHPVFKEINDDGIFLRLK